MKVQTKQKKWVSIGIGLSILLLLAIGIYNFKQSQGFFMTYSAFWQEVREGKVKEVSIGDDPYITFKQVGDDRLYKTENPRTTDFKEALLLNNIKVTEGYNSTAFYFVQMLISATVFIGVFYIIFKGTKRHTGIQQMALGIKAIEADDLKTGFAQIAGNQEVKEQVEDLIGFMKDPQKYTRLGARMPKGLIFYGPPGTGKTLMAKAIAKEAGVPFFSLSGSDFVQMYVGVGASRIREVFKEARKHEKSVIFIDEIDAIGKKRSNNLSGSNEEKDQTLNALLTEMSGFKYDEGIVVIAATNRLELLDEALLRPGRFDRQIEIGYPDQVAREQIIRLYLQDKPISDEVDSKKLAKQTVRFTGAMLENLLNEAAILASKMDERKITMDHIEKAFSIVLAGAEKKDCSYITEEERRITAYHEAGHALMTKLMVPMQRIVKVTIVPTIKGAGGFSMSIPKDSMYMTKRDFMHQIQIALAGRAAEEIIFGKDLVTTGASNDIEQATYYLKELVTRYGMDDAYGLINCEILCPGSSNQELLTVCKEKMDQIYEETKCILKEHEDMLKRLADALLKYETLNENQIMKLMI